MRPDIEVPGNIHIEVKNYNIANNVNGLIHQLKQQVQNRQNNLPSGATQQVYIDARGQNLTQQQISALETRLMNDLQFQSLTDIIIYW